ncbi:MAG TPA: glycosyltransferase family 4 protein [Gaiellaceae bacterium]|nr:glycosyltransferase family 4 protein [Gaiellaceae bacterium]
MILGRLPGSRPRILVLNQYYWPGVEATAHLLSQLCPALAEAFDVTVVTGRLRGPAGLPGRQVVEGVEIVRVNSTSFDRRNLGLRALNYATYLGQSLREGLASEPPDIVLCMTDPPMLGDVGLVLARRFRVPLVVIAQDVFPEVAVALKRLDNPALIGLLRLLIRLYLERADRIVAIGETMRERLERKGASPAALSVIPNWVDTRAVTPQAKDNEWAREHGLADRFVVMHSGNIGHAQNLDALIRASTFLRDLEDLAVVIIGDGARRVELQELAGRLEADSVVFLPYQAREQVPYSLSTGDVHFVGLARGLAGYVVPSRLYGILAAGRPAIVAADAEGETAEVVERVGCGVVVPPGRPERLAEAIRRAHAGELDLDELGRRGREYVVTEADREVALSRYRELLTQVLAGEPPR